MYESTSSIAFAISGSTVGAARAKGRAIEPDAKSRSGPASSSEGMPIFAGGSSRSLSPKPAASASASAFWLLRSAGASAGGSPSSTPTSRLSSSSSSAAAGAGASTERSRGASGAASMAGSGIAPKAGGVASPKVSRESSAETSTGSTASAGSSAGRASDAEMPGQRVSASSLSILPRLSLPSFRATAASQTHSRAASSARSVSLKTSFFSKRPSKMFGKRTRTRSTCSSALSRRPYFRNTRDSARCSSMNSRSVLELAETPSGRTIAPVSNSRPSRSEAPTVAIGGGRVLSAAAFFSTATLAGPERTGAAFFCRNDSRRALNCSLSGSTATS